MQIVRKYDTIKKQNTHTPKTTGCYTSTNKKRKKVIWFSSSFSLIVKTNVGEIILRFVKRHFAKENPLQKIFNTNTLKVNCSCMGNYRIRLINT